MHIKKNIFIIIFIIFSLLQAKELQAINYTYQRQAQQHLQEIITANQEISFTITLIDKKDKKLKNITNLGNYLFQNKQDMFLHKGKLVIVGQNWIAVEN